MAPEEEPAASSESSLLVESLLSALDSTPVYERLLDDIASAYVRGDVNVAEAARHFRRGPPFALINTLRYEELRLDKEAQEQLGPERMKVLHRLHGKYFSLMEDIFDAMVELNVYGIENTWNAVHSQPLYHPDDETLLMRLEIEWGPYSLYHALDRTDDFIRLGATILERCRDALDYVVDKKLSLRNWQRNSILRDIGRVEEVTTSMTRLRSAFGEDEEPTPKARRRSRSSRTSESGTAEA